MDYTNISRLDGRVALVTGAARGLGSEIAHALMQVGACVMITDVRESVGNETLSALATKAPGRVAFMQQDITQESDWIATLQATIGRFGGLDIVVNHADLASAGLFADCELSDFQRSMALHVESAFLGIKHAIRSMRPGGTAGRGGSIINLSAGAHAAGSPSQAASGACVGAVRMLTKTAAAECARLEYGIRVNSIQTGALGHAAPPPMSPGMPAMGSHSHCSDVANAVLFLAGDASRWVTGSEMVIDGGASDE